jgi:hypothetical protein
VDVYINNVLEKTGVPQNQSITFSLPAFRTGKIFILSKYLNNTEAAAVKVLF